MIASGETKVPQVELIHEDINDAHQAIFANPILEAVREKCRPRPIRPFDETRHSALPQP